MAVPETFLTNPNTVGSWILIPDRSTVAFKSRTFWGMLNVKGTFSEISGDGQVTGPGAVFGRLTVRTESLKTGIAKRDAHLRSPDFFDSENYPEIRLVVTAAAMSGPQRVDLRCRLTVTAITEMVNLPATVEVIEDGSIRVSGRTSLDRSAFGVSGNMGGMMGSITKVSGDLVFRREAT